MKHILKRVLLSTCLVMTGAFGASAATADSWPERPIKIILGFAPGGPVDSSARIAAQILSDRLGKAVVVENHAGAGGTIASRMVAKSPPDGYTLLVNATSDIINPIVDKNAGYSIEKDFTPIGLIASAPNVLVVHPSLPVKSVAELVAYARANPAAISYGSAGVNTVSHLGGVLLSAMASAPMTHIPYRGTGLAQTDFLAGRLPVMFDGLVTGLANAKLGKARALAVTSAQRWPSSPEIPTVAESGYPGYSLLAIFGLMAPAGTPAPIIERISTALLDGLRTDSVRERIAFLGAVPGHWKPAEYRAYLNGESARWAKLYAEGMIKSE